MAHRHNGRHHHNGNQRKQVQQQSHEGNRYHFTVATVFAKVVTAVSNNRVLIEITGTNTSAAKPLIGKTFTVFNGLRNAKLRSRPNTDYLVEFLLCGNTPNGSVGDDTDTDGTLNKHVGGEIAIFARYTDDPEFTTIEEHGVSRDVKLSDRFIPRSYALLSKYEVARKNALAEAEAEEERDQVIRDQKSSVYCLTANHNNTSIREVGVPAKIEGFLRKLKVTDLSELTDVKWMIWDGDGEFKESTAAPLMNLTPRISALPQIGERTPLKAIPPALAALQDIKTSDSPKVTEPTKKKKPGRKQAA